MLNRVVVTGFGNVCAFGREWNEIRAKFEAKQNAVKFMSEWDRFGAELNTRLAAPIVGYAPPKEWDRKQLRSLGIVSQYAVEAAGLALKDAGLLGDESIKDGRMGVAAGSSTGSTEAMSSAVTLLLGMESNYIHKNDAAHHGGKYFYFLWAKRSHDTDKFGLHERKPRHRILL